MSSAAPPTFPTQSVDLGDGRTFRFPLYASYERYAEIVDCSPILIEFETLRDGRDLVDSTHRAGRLVLRPGGPAKHADITTNVLCGLGNALREAGCRIRGPGLRIRTPDGSEFYPDVSVFCEPDAFAPGRTDVLTNPLLVIEVLSPSTSNRDLGVKLERYLAMPSVREYAVVSTDRYAVQRYVRQDDGWLLQLTIGRDADVEFASVNVTLPMAEVYRHVQIEEPPPEQVDGSDPMR